jgi:hypothetical protein
MVLNQPLEQQGVEKQASVRQPKRVAIWKTQHNRYDYQNACQSARVYQQFVLWD